MQLIHHNSTSSVMKHVLVDSSSSLYLVTRLTLNSASMLQTGKMEQLLWLTWLVLGGFLQVFGNPDAKRLYDDLLSNYNRLIRPVGNNSDRLTVKMGLRLSQLIDVVMLLA